MKSSFFEKTTGEQTLNVMKYILGLLMTAVLLAACQPELVLVDVTRLVEVTPEDANSAAGAEAPDTQPSEAAGTVTQEVTRVVTRTVVEELIVEVTKTPVGSPQRPIQLLFSPSVGTDVISRRGQVLADALAESTGLAFQVGILDDEETVRQLMCAAPEEAMGFLSPAGFVMAERACGAQAGNVALRTEGLPWQMGMIVARRDSGIVSLADLSGRRLAIPEAANAPHVDYFLAQLKEAGIEPAEIVSLPGDSSAMLAVYNREIDAAAAVYVPPILPYDERQWTYGEDSPEIWRRVGISPSRSPIGYVLVNGEPEFGGYRLRDARSRVFDVLPEIYDETLIVALSAPVPNDTVAFGARFPLQMARQIMPALAEFAASEECISSLCSADFYGWTGLALAEAADYEPVRFILDILTGEGDGVTSP